MNIGARFQKLQFITGGHWGQMNNLLFPAISNSNCTLPFHLFEVILLIGDFVGLVHLCLLNTLHEYLLTEKAAQVF